MPPPRRMTFIQALRHFPLGSDDYGWIESGIFSRRTIGVLLVLYSLYNLIRPTVEPVPGSVTADFGVGVANGLIGGLTGLGGIAVTIWCQLRGGMKDAQRATFQPVMFATFVMSAISLAVAGVFSLETIKLYALALPALIVGVWCGLKLYWKAKRCDIPQDDLAAAALLWLGVDRADALN